MVVNAPLRSKACPQAAPFATFLSDVVFGTFFSRDDAVVKVSQNQILIWRRFFLKVLQQVF
jgi:hypothetical protein